MIREAAVAPVKRRATRPSWGSQERRLACKGVRAGTKAMRRRPEAE
jgi:ribosome-associated protein